MASYEVMVLAGKIIAALCILSTLLHALALALDTPSPPQTELEKLFYGEVKESTQCD